MNNSQSYVTIFLRNHLQDKVCSLCLSQNRHFVKNMAVVLRIQEDFPTLLQDFNVNEDRICWECNAQLRKFIRFHNQVQLARDMLNKMSDNAEAGYMPKINSMSRLSRSSIQAMVHIVPRESMPGSRGILPKGNDTVPSFTNGTLPMPSMPRNERFPPKGNEIIPPSSTNVTLPVPSMPWNPIIPLIEREIKPIIVSIKSLSQNSVPGVNTGPSSTFPPYECQTVVPYSVKIELEETLPQEQDTSEIDSCPPDIKEELEDELPDQSQNKVLDLDQILNSMYVQKPPILFSNSPEYNLPVRNTIPWNTVQNTSNLEQYETVPVNTSSNQMTVTSGPSNVDPTGGNNHIKIIISKRMVMELREKERVYLSNMKTGFNCDKCIVNIQNEEIYKNHMAKHDPSAGPEVCDICEMRFPNKVALDPHYKSHFRAFACNRCYKATFVCRLWSTMQTHLRIHDIPGCAACGECGTAFENTVLLKEHIDSMHRLECPKCKKKFTSKAKADRHMHFMHKEMKCEKCNLTIRGLKALMFHKRTSKVCYGDPGDGVVIAGEDGSSQSYCAKCNKFFKSRNILVNHLKTHSSHVGIRFKCDYCGKGYSAKTSLIGHIQLTHNNRGIACKTCGKIFATKQGQRKHQDSHLKKKREPTHPCDVCGKMFSSQAVLKKHLLIHSGIRP